MKVYRSKLIEEKSTEELKKGIIQELRTLISSSAPLIQLEVKIRKIQISKFLLDDRKSSIYNEVDELEQKTKWKFTKLFEDCIAYPDNSIYPAKYHSIDMEGNSICEVCEVCEVCEEEDMKNLTNINKKINICDSCLGATLKSITNKSRIEGCFLFKTPEKKILV